MQTVRRWIVALADALVTVTAPAAELTRAQALAALARTDAALRLATVERLADADPRVRIAADAALGQIWGRSGDPAIDKLYASGVEQMQAAALDDALATFNEIVRRKPAFAEGWN